MSRSSLLVPDQVVIDFILSLIAYPLVSSHLVLFTCPVPGCAATIKFNPLTCSPFQPHESPETSFLMFCTGLKDSEKRGDHPRGLDCVAGELHSDA